MITKTNGVSFSLAVGSCCLVVSSNGWSYSESDLTASPRSLNINSTGAKYISFKYFTAEGHFMRYKVTTLNSNSKSGNAGLYNSFWNTNYSSAAILFVYDGSYYLSTYTPLRAYEDYSDD